MSQDLLIGIHAVEAALNYDAGNIVELVDSKITGLVHITQLPNDYYHFDAVRHLLTGERRGLKFRLGDPVRVQVLRASLEDRKIDFRLVSEEPERKRR